MTFCSNGTARFLAELRYAQSLISIQVLDEESDTLVLFNLLRSASTTEGYQRIYCSIEGPWASLLFNKKTKLVYFGRDCLGRRSLLYRLLSLEEGELLEISSVHSDNNEQCPWREASCGALDAFCCDPGAFSFKQAVLASALNFAISKVSCKLAAEGQSLAGLVAALSSLLERSIARRLPKAKEGRIKILFSGGVDSAILAALASKVAAACCQIELINVAFEAAGYSWEDVPDRISASIALGELEKLFPSRTFHLVKINVTKLEYADMKPHVIRLLRPNNNQMDLSIGAALWFGSRHPASDGNSRALLIGAGADELFGGYRRHKYVLSENDWSALASELHNEIQFIGRKTLGRDDRCVSDNGVEARWPFLDERIVRFGMDLPIDTKLSTGVFPGKMIDKLILRELCCSLGFSELVYNSPKRAIQFGSKSSKMNGKSKSGYSTLEE